MRQHTKSITSIANCTSNSLETDQAMPQACRACRLVDSSLLRRHNLVQPSSCRGSQAVHRAAAPRCTGSLYQGPKRSLGQNFMTDKNTLTKIIRLLGLQATDLVVEIGPGQGALTRCLLASGATVLAVEKDTVLSAQLQSTLAQEKLPGFLGVIEADIMALSVSSLLDHLHGLVPGDRKGQHKVKVVANMPFNITTEVIRHLLPQGDFISQVNLLIEEGAAQRLVKARPGQDIYRSINCLVHYFATPHYHFRVPRTVFYPRPHVDAAMTTFALKPASDRLLDARLESGFVKFVEKAFLAKRKRLRNTLGPQYSSSQVEAALQAVGLKQDTRAVELSASSYALLYAELGSSLKH